MGTSSVVFCFQVAPQQACILALREAFLASGVNFVPDHVSLLAACPSPSECFESGESSELSRCMLGSLSSCISSLAHHVRGNVASSVPITSGDNNSLLPITSGALRVAFLVPSYQIYSSMLFRKLRRDTVYPCICDGHYV